MTQIWVVEKFRGCRLVKLAQESAHGWLGRLVAGLSTRGPEFVPRSFHVGFLVDKVTLGQVFLRVHRFPLLISFHQGSGLSYHLGHEQ
jgi:hypothetical protein